MNDSPINITKLSFDDWVKFTFDHPVEDKDWYWKEEWNYTVGDVNALTDYMIRLFESPKFLLDKYSPEQINAGFWFISGPEGYFVTSDSDDLLEEKVMRVIAAMEILYRDIFHLSPMNELAGYMWWDWRAESFILTGGKPYDESHAKVQNAMLKCIKKVLYMESEHCQKAALHGLSHLMHPQTKKIIDSYLQTHPDISDELKLYALDCREWKAL